MYVSAYRSMMVMMGAMRAPAHAALVASAPRRQASLSVFHLDCGCDWDADVMAMGRRWPSLVFAFVLVPVVVVVVVIALAMPGMREASDCDTASSVFMRERVIGVKQGREFVKMGEYRAASFEIGVAEFDLNGLLCGQMQVSSSIYPSSDSDVLRGTEYKKSCG